MKYEFFSFHPLFPYFHCWAVSRTPSSPARLQLDMRAMENEKKIIIWSSSYSWEEKSPKICWWTFRIHVCKIAENWKSISHPKVMREQPPSVCIARDWNWHNLSNKIVSFKGNFPQATAVSTALRLYILSKWHISTKLSWVFIWRIPTTPQKGETCHFWRLISTSRSCWTARSAFIELFNPCQGCLSVEAIERKSKISRPIEISFYGWIIFFIPLKRF